jgi:hypothetical protein
MMPPPTITTRACEFIRAAFLSVEA